MLALSTDLVIAVLLAAVPPPGAAAGIEPADWKVGLAQAKITPEKPIFLAGYPGRVRPHDTVDADIFVKALVLEDQAGARAALVTVDLVGVSPALTEPACERVRARTRIACDRIVYNASHNHSGPVINVAPKAGPGMKPEDVVYLAAYARQVQDRIGAVLVQAAARLLPARLSRGTGVIHFAMNRREFTPRGIILGVNPRGLVDRSVPVLRVDGADGRLRAVVFGAACHNTTVGGRSYALSGDYAGFAQAHLEERRPGAQAMFVQGFGADANPYPRGDGITHARAHGVALAEEVLRVIEGGKLRPLSGPLRVASGAAALPFEPSRAELERIAARDSGITAETARELLAAIDRGEALPTHHSMPITLWQLGDLTLVALSGEVGADYVDIVERAIGPLDLWLSAYSNDVFGYVTSARVQREGGYEAKGVRGRGFFALGTQEVIAGTVRTLARQVGRALPP